MQRAAEKAQSEANAKIQAAQAKADEAARDAQAEADKKIAAESGDFMTLREDYRHTATLNMVAFDKKVADLEAKAKTATGKEKSELEAKVKDVKAQHQVFMKDYSGLDNETAATWDATRARLDAEWAALEARLDAI